MLLKWVGGLLDVQWRDFALGKVVIEQGCWALACYKQRIVDDGGSHGNKMRQQIVVLRVVNFVFNVFDTHVNVHANSTFSTMFTHIGGEALGCQVTGRLETLSIGGDFLILAAAHAKKATSGHVASIPIGVDVVGTDAQHQAFGVIACLV